MRLLPCFFLLTACLGAGGREPDGDTVADADADSDADGYADDEDCDDGDGAIHPGADEVCDGIDNDCDRAVDDAPVDGLTVYADADGDGFGDAAASGSACTLEDGQTDVSGDCDDGDPAVHPGAEESDCADPTDYNCDGQTGYADEDADGWAACTECDDADAARNPGATETCNDVDDDCDAETDEAGAVGEDPWDAD
jgi:hypothetical protein